MNKKNLIKLAKYILSEISGEDFDMRNFRSSSTKFPLEFYSKEDCGTVGCALGWSPFVPGLEAIEDDFYSWGALCFKLYSKRVFGGDDVGSLYFIFSGDWHEIDNSREGFVKRVIYFLD